MPRRGLSCFVLTLMQCGVTLAAPVISEFLASNDGGLTDEDGDFSDWIELHNPDPAPVSLDGYFLTDSAGNLTKWRLPDVTLNPGAYLVVFASDKDRALAGSPLHTSFKLSAGGEYLALVGTDGVSVLTEFAPSFPLQFADISYGFGISTGTVTTTHPIVVGHGVRYLVPKSGEPAGDWHLAIFDDSGWGAANTGLGFGYPGFPIGTNGDLTAAMYDTVHGSVYVRFPFEIDDPAEVVSMTLRMKIDDGFAAYLNGELVASMNASASLTHDSLATDGTEIGAGDPFDVYPLDFSGHLETGTNILAFHGLNLTHGGSDFLIVPELDMQLQDLSAGLTAGYFETPTPGLPNGSATAGFIKDTNFSVRRGFFKEAFPLEISTETPGVEIRYTTDGSDPTESHGTVYAGPITISETTTLRAAAFSPGYLPTNIDTQTYVFLADVRTQAITTQSYWDTGMDPNVVNAPGIYTVEEGLADIPTLSIVMDPDDLFGSANGIYTHATAEASLDSFWEKKCSAEYFYHPDYDGPYRVGDGFQIDCGIAISGNFSRLSHNPKHSFRIKFKETYGASKLEFPLFSTSPVDEYDTLTIRTGHNQGWATNNASSQMMRDQHSRDIQGFDPTQAVSDGNHIHLYLNGQYWGVYFLSERPDDSFGAEHYGGQKEEYDAFKGLSRGGSSQAEIVSGNRTAWAEMFALAAQDLSDPAKYEQMQQYVDIDQLIDYTIGVLYQGDLDGPTGLGASATQPKNFYSVRRRHVDGRFRFFRWDSEFIFGSINDDMSERSGTENPAALHFSLRRNPEYRRRFGDRVHRYFFNAGAFSIVGQQQFYHDRSEQVGKAMVAESARWGDAKREPPFTRDVHWINERNRITNVWMPGRHNVILNQFRTDGLYPSIEAPVLHINASPKHGGPIASTDPLSMTAPQGSIYFTTDGTDPRAFDEDVEFNTHVLVGESAVKRALLPTDATDEQVWFGDGFDDSAWPAGTKGAGYENGAGYEVLLDTNLDVVSQISDFDNETIYLRTSFEVVDPDLYDTLSLFLRYDDGFVAYLNGVEIARDRAGGTPNTPIAWNAGAATTHDDVLAMQFLEFPINGHLGLLRAGTNVLAVHGLNSGTSSSDFVLWPKLEAREITGGGSGSPWSATATEYTAAVTLSDTTTLRARTLLNGEWSALAEAIFLVDSQPAAAGNLVIPELDYQPASPTAAETTEGYDKRKDFEFIELLNIGQSVIDLADIAFTDGILFDFNTRSAIHHLLPGERILIVKNREAFLFRYPDVAAGWIAGEYSQRLDDNGDAVVLIGATGADIVNFTYDDKNPWPGAADGDGNSLVLVRPESDPDTAVASNWRASIGAPTPGGDDRPTLNDWLADNGLTDPNAVPEGYPVSSLLLYALGVDLGGDPADALFVVSVEEHTVGDVADFYLTLTYTVRAGVEDVGIVPEISTDLATWQVGETVSRVSSGEGTETVVVRDTEPFSAGRFARLKAITN